MYADDTTVYASAKSISELSSIQDKELKMVEQWVSNNKLILNISKTKSIGLGSNKSLKHKPKLNLLINNIPVVQVTEAKLVSVYLDNKLSWSRQIEFITKNKGKSLAAVRRCRQYLPAEMANLVA